MDASGVSVSGKVFCVPDNCKATFKYTENNNHAEKKGEVSAWNHIRVTDQSGRPKSLMFALHSWA